MGRYHITICSAKTCYNSSERQPNKSFFPFPKDSKWCRQWLNNCGRTEVSPDKVTRSGGYYRICEDHFEDKCFTDSSRTLLNKRIKPIPTIFIDNIRNLCPSRENNHIDTDSSLLISNDLDPQIDQHDLTNSETETIHFVKDLDLICRFCLNELQDEHIEIFSESFEAMEIRKMFDSIIQKKMNIFDGFPPRACPSCVNDLKTCYKIIERFKKSYSYLRTIAENLELDQTQVNYRILDNIGQDLSMIIQDKMIIPKPTSDVISNRLACDKADAEEQFMEGVNSSPSNEECNEGPYSMYIESDTDDIFCKLTSSHHVNKRKKKISESNINSDNVENSNTYPLAFDEELNIESHEMENNPKSSPSKREKNSNKIRKCNDTMTFKCNVCISDPVIFNKKDDLQIHYKEKHNIRCSLCDYSFTRQVLLDQHKCKACEICGKVFSNLKARIRHEKVTYPCCDVKEICWICGVIVNGLSNFRNHLQSHDNNILNCDNCFKSFSTAEELTIHKQIHYPQQYKRDYLCEFCSKRFTDYNNLLQHLNISHKSKRKYHCNFCKKHFNGKITLSKHRRGCIAKKEKLKSFKDSGAVPAAANRTCNICMRKFVKASSLSMHRIYHFCNGDKTVINQLLNEPEINKCEVCNKLFYSKISWLFHRRKHTNDSNPIKCDICDFACDNYLRMTLHVQQHNSECSYKCLTCDRLFLTKYCLIKHRRKHYKDNAKNSY